MGNKENYDDVMITSLKRELKDLGYKFFENGKYNLNIIGVRRNTPIASDTFRDTLYVIYKDSDEKDAKFILKKYKITTTPGISQLDKPSNVKGTAILVPNQYCGSWKLGLHKGQYEALVQIKPVKVYRDNNKDHKYDFSPKATDNGIFGINIHRASPNHTSTIVGDWSAGCQVFSDPKEFNEFITLCKKQNEVYKSNNFTYTLITE